MIKNQRESSITNVETSKDPQGTILIRPLPAVFLAGLNFTTWIRDDLPPARSAYGSESSHYFQKGIPDKRNDQRKGSHLWENRRKIVIKL